MERRFFCPDIPEVNEVTSLPDDESNHFRTVLRGRQGDDIVLLNGKGVIATARVLDIGGRRQPVNCRVVDRKVVNRPAVQFRIYVAPPRGKGMVGIVRSATELGVDRITPIITERVTSKPEKTALANWRSAAIAAMKQSINPYCPDLDSPCKLSEILTGDVDPGFVGWVPDESPASLDVQPDTSAVSLFIGPEGGFSDDELKAIVDKGIVPVSFGHYVLRVETAVVAGLSWMNQRFRN